VSCDCIERVTELLVRERKVKLLITVNLTTGQSKVQIPTEPVAGEKRPKFHLIPKFCPFCGKEYEPEAK
jgi:hypothetical protein